MSTADSAILAALRHMRLVGGGDTPKMAPLTGGVSSDIWRVELPAGPICVKRALPQLKVASVWEAPVERNRYEWAWLQEAARVAPQQVPPLLGHDPQTGCFAMRYLDPVSHPSWKTLLHRGVARTDTAAEVGRRLAAIHGATAGRADLARRFATGHIFHAIRLEPYLLATAARHAGLAARLRELASRTAATRRVLVHGDVSPKNILVGPAGPVFLDAECAWYGDPAFDLAFCLNHLLLKCLWTPAATTRFLEAFDVLAGAYLGAVDWEPRAAVEERSAHLLPGLLLARVDGKSPVEYITSDIDRQRVRRVGAALLRSPVAALAGIRAAWAAELAETAPAARPASSADGHRPRD